MTGQRAVAVVLLGAAGSGKSTLLAALLAAAGAAPATAPGPGRLAHAALLHDGVRLSLLDPPGAPDLAGELYAGLRAADVAVLVVSPVQGVDPRSVALWDALAHLPRLVVLSQLDRPGADADEAVAVCRRVLGEGVQALQLPLHDDDGSVVGLLDLLALLVSEGAERRAADPEHAALVEGLRGELLEAVLTGSDDQRLFEGWLADVEPPLPVLGAELAAAVGRGDLQPVLVTSPRREVGLVDLLDLLVRLPAREAPPVSAPDGPGLALAGDPDGPLVAELVRAGLLKLWSGTIRPGQPVWVGGPRTTTGPARSTGHPATYSGPAASAGDVVEAELDALPGQTVTAVGSALVLAGWSLPPALFPVGVRPDDDLAERVRQDPVARLSADGRTGQLLLWTYGPEHAERLLQGLPSAPVQVPPGGRPVGLLVEVPAWAERAVRTDVAARSGVVVGSSTSEHGVRLEVRLPAAELPGYAPALGRVSAYTARLSRPGANAG